MTEYNSFTRKIIFIAIATLFASMSMIVRAGTSTAPSQSIIDVDRLDDGTEVLRFREANYTTLNRTIKYNSTTMNDPKGMAPLYKISNQILDLFLGEDAIPEGVYDNDMYDATDLHPVSFSLSPSSLERNEFRE